MFHFIHVYFKVARAATQHQQNYPAQKSTVPKDRSSGVGVGVGVCSDEAHDNAEGSGGQHLEFV